MASVSALRPYVPPPWVQAVPWLAARAPKQRLPGLVNLPTPVVRWELPEQLVPAGFRLWVKRDDATGCEVSGNKARKLQFLLADALEKGCDCVVTIGGEQSNHARATACAARAVGLEPHLILRTDKKPEVLGLSGNILLNRLAGARIYLATMQEYWEQGSEALLERLGAELRAQGRRPCLIPSGGSNGVGTWGYLDAVHELQAQMGSEGVPAFSDIVVATGSGGTAGGLALGAHLAQLGSRMHAFCVCDTPDYFYKHIDEDVIRDLVGSGTVPPARELIHIRNAKGIGYAKSTPSELQLIADVARHSGIILDHVYSGKAFGGLLQLMREEPEALQGRDVLFWHTGGLYGVFDKAPELATLFDAGEVQLMPRVRL